MRRARLRWREVGCRASMERLGQNLDPRVPVDVERDHRGGTIPRRGSQRAPRHPPQRRRAGPPLPESRPFNRPELLTALVCCFGDPNGILPVVKLQNARVFEGILQELPEATSGVGMLVTG
jgi:hypothetical protein